MTVNTVSSPTPSASSGLQPVNSWAAGLISRTRPRGSVAISPSLTLTRVVANHRRLSPMASSALFRSSMSVQDPNQRSSALAGSRTGTARLRCQR